MRSELPEIGGSTKNICENYRIMDKKNFNEKLFENMVNPQRKYEKIDNFKIPEENVKLLWFLREYGGALEFITNLMELEVELFRVHENDKEKVLLDKIIRLVKDKDNREVWSTFKILANEPSECLGAYVISMTNSASDIFFTL